LPWTFRGWRTNGDTGFSLPVWLGIPTLIVSVAAPLIVAVVLLRRAGARRATVAPRPSATR
jgi:hypothetical protein